MFDELNLGINLSILLVSIVAVVLGSVNRNMLRESTSRDASISSK